MAFKLFELFGKIKVDKKDAEKSVKSFKSSLASLGKSLKKFGNFAIGVFKRLAIAGIAVAAISLRNFFKQVEAESKLEQALANIGKAAHSTAEELKKMASEFQKVSNFGDETILGAQKTLLIFQKIGKVNFSKALESVLDFAEVFKDKELVNSAIMIGRALNDPIRASTLLGRRLGEFSKGQQATIKGFMDQNNIMEAQGVILDILASKIGGQAKAASKTPLGKLNQVWMRLGDLTEKAGEIISRVIGKVILPKIDALLKKFEDASGNLDIDKIVKDISEELEKFIDMLPSFEKMIDMVKGFAKGINLALNALGKFKVETILLMAGFAKLGTAITTALALMSLYTKFVFKLVLKTKVLTAMNYLLAMSTAKLISVQTILVNVLAKTIQIFTGLAGVIKSVAVFAVSAAGVITSAFVAAALAIGAAILDAKKASNITKAIKDVSKEQGKLRDKLKALKAELKDTSDLNKRIAIMKEMIAVTDKLAKSTEKEKKELEDRTGFFTTVFDGELNTDKELELANKMLDKLSVSKAALEKEIKRTKALPPLTAPQQNLAKGFTPNLGAGGSTKAPEFVGLREFARRFATTNDEKDLLEEQVDILESIDSTLKSKNSTGIQFTR